MLFFLLRKDFPAAAVAGASAAVHVVLGFAFAWHTSVGHWFTGCRPDSGRAWLTVRQQPALARVGVGPPAGLLIWAVIAAGSITAMATALAGARCGAKALPPAWRSRTPAADRLASATSPTHQSRDI